MSLIEGRRGLRRRPLWEFEIDTARQQLNLQFGTRDLVGFGVENAPRGLCAAGCLLQYAKDTQRTTLPHIRSITMEREQDSIIRMPRRVVIWKSPRTWRVVRKIRWLLCSTAPSRRWAAVC
ncbi:DNA mismatch repair protein MutS [Escherichia coli]|nr:DNA mismatch repair protein MutS [Escherichia coli]